MSVDIRQPLVAAIDSGMPLPGILEVVRGLKNRGHSRAEVRDVLEALRAEADSEGIEDRILEVLDFVAGFCAAEQRIWSEDADRPPSAMPR